VSAYQGNARQGKVTLLVGVVAVLLGFVMQAINVHSFATQGPMMFSNSGSTVLLGQIAGFVILGGVLLTIFGIVRYAQSGSDGSSVIGAAPIQRTGASTFCSSCGARIVGAARYCASCGKPTGS
jgi:hypothetical protein